MAKKSANEKLQEKIFLDKKSSWHDLKKEQVFKFAENYKKFMKESKTERLCIENVLKVLKKDGFKDINTTNNAKEGDKVYKVIRGKAVFAAIIGKNPSKWQLIGSHVDSPRLDLKPLPVYEDSGLGLIKTHYYGGVKKYHWVNTPLALHGVAFTKAGKKGAGVIAQELQEIAPELVHANEDGVLSVAYGDIVGYLIEAIKTLKQEIESIKADD